MALQEPILEDSTVPEFDVDTDISFGELMEAEFESESEYEYYDDVSDSFDSENDLSRYEDSLLKSGSIAVKLNREMMRNTEAISDDMIDQLTRAVTGLSSLLNEFGKPEALDDLIILLGELDEILAPGPLAQVTETLEEFAKADTLPLKDQGHLGESVEQVTLELQEHLIQALDMESLKERNRTIIDAFINDNPNFIGDKRLETLLSSF